MPSFDAINRRRAKPIPPINLLPDPPKKRRKYKWLVLFLVLLLGLIWGGTTLLSKTNQIFTNDENIFSRLGKLLIVDDKPLIGEDQGVVNVLLLGMGGPGHDGPLLTDTIIVASINLQSKDITLVSIPRDFRMNLTNGGFNKINAAYAFAENSQENTGGESAIEEVEKLTGLEIPYFAAIDFKGFVNAVNQVGGLDIVVDNTFTDSQYPNYNKGYLPPVTFTAGPEHMDGERALIFARSRHGTNGEGSDFARSNRQKKVMVAFKEKISGLNISNLGTVNNLLSSFAQNFRTNFEPYEIRRMATLLEDVDSNHVYTLSLEPQGTLICNILLDLRTGLRYVPPAQPAETEPGDEGDESEPTTGNDDAPTTDATGDGEATGEEIVEDPQIPIYVVQPCSGKSLTDVHAFLESALSTAALQKENAKIEVQNSTGIAAATSAWRELSGIGLDIEFATYKGRAGYERTIIYDNSRGAKPKTVEYLQQNFNATLSDVPFYESQPDSEIVVIIGADGL